MVEGAAIVRLNMRAPRVLSIAIFEQKKLSEAFSEQLRKRMAACKCVGVVSSVNFTHVFFSRSQSGGFKMRSTEELSARHLFCE